jgi:hypothetical protein
MGSPGGDGGYRLRTEPLDRIAPRRSADRPAAADPVARVGQGVYRTRRPAAAILFTVVAVLLELPALWLLLAGAFGSPVSASSVVSGVLLVCGLPALALGLYALTTSVGRFPGRGAGQGPDPEGGAAWLRPPLGYLTVGLVLVVAAALAT